ncbi:DUF4469 domain-containing protein [Parabacteroides gordonii]|uniref:DUF4469 domain-containing protein n=1 Tax=Parabacteroides gordonii TaxID=574930 RepID=UPI0026EDFCCF|nr:DUF4469 domain-containing protein [Parabacteroides gordonii]
MAKDPTQKAKLTLKALDLALTQDITNDCYLQPKLQKCLNMHDLASEVAALSTRQEDVEEIARTGNQIMRRMIWYLSSGYSISTVLGYFRPTSQGVFLESELTSAPDRKRLKLGVAYSMSQEMRQALADAEIDVEIQKSVSGPQLFTVVSAQDAQNPEAAARGEGVPVSSGQACIIKGKHIKVGGEGEQIGVTIRRADGDSGETFFFPVPKLYPNTPTQVGFVLPATVVDGSVWSVTLCTQLGNNGVLLKTPPRTATMSGNFVVGDVSETPGGGEDDRPVIE